MANAVTAGDKKAFDMLTHKNYVETFDKTIITKDEILKILSASPGTTFQYPKMDVEIYGNAALVRGIALWNTDTTTNEKVYVQFSDMFVKEINDWKMVNSHVSSIASWQAVKLRDDELTGLVTSVRCEDGSSLKSINSEQSAFIRFKNATNSQLTIYWIDYNGKRDQKRSLAPASSIDLKTYLTHPFIVIKEDESCYGIFVPVVKPGLVLVQ